MPTNDEYNAILIELADHQRIIEDLKHDLCCVIENANQYAVYLDVHGMKIKPCRFSEYTRHMLFENGVTDDPNWQPEEGAAFGETPDRHGCQRVSS